MGLGADSPLTCARFRGYDSVHMRMRILPGILPCGALLAIAAGLLGASLSIHGSPLPRNLRHGYRHEIEQMEEQWRSAMVGRNSAVLEGLLSDDYTGITASGAIQTRDQLLSSLSTGALQISNLAISERKVRIYGATAVVTSVAEVTGARADSEISGRYRYTRVYVRGPQGDWKIVSFEASRIQEPGERK